MSQCWYETPTDRPTFSDLRQQVENLLSRNGNYLDLNNLGIPVTYDSDNTTFHSSAENVKEFKAGTEVISGRRKLSDFALGGHLTTSPDGSVKTSEKKVASQDSEKLLPCGDSCENGFDEDTPPVVAERKDIRHSSFCRKDPFVPKTESATGIPLEQTNDKIDFVKSQTEYQEDASCV